jgi:hypothetical protein
LCGGCVRPCSPGGLLQESVEHPIGFSEYLSHPFDVPFEFPLELGLKTLREVDVEDAGGTPYSEHY